MTVFVTGEPRAVEFDVRLLCPLETRRAVRVFAEAKLADEFFKYAEGTLLRPTMLGVRADGTVILEGGAR